ncbi:MAG: DUF1858 domain-containing protein [Candidatus Altimarinota bacterium]
MNHQPPKITGDMIVGDVVALFPEAADIINSYGLHCVGCHANAFETLEQGLMGHGYTEEHLKSLLEELNEYWEEINEGNPKQLPKEAEEMKITVTEFALKKILEIADREKKPEIIIRIEAKKFGDTVKYAMNFIEQSEIHPDEKVFSFKKGKILIAVDKWNYKNINGLKVDYVEEEDREGFKMKKG